MKNNLTERDMLTHAEDLKTKDAEITGDNWRDDLADAMHGKAIAQAVKPEGTAS